jgi:hypothetical protein
MQSIEVLHTLERAAAFLGAQAGTMEDSWPIIDMLEDWIIQHSIVPDSMELVQSRENQSDYFIVNTQRTTPLPQFRIHLNKAIGVITLYYPTDPELLATGFAAVTNTLVSLGGFQN